MSLCFQRSSGRASIKQTSANGYFFDQWAEKEKHILIINRISTTIIECTYYEGKHSKHCCRCDLTMGLPKYLASLNIREKSVMIDLSALDHITLMYLTKLLITRIVPRTLFASYIRPINYNSTRDDSGISLTDKIQGISAVPGFAKRELHKSNLYAFVGFEGVRLKGIIESVNNIDKLMPIVAFPSSALHWYNITMWNSMDILSETNRQPIVYKCFSESVFEAVQLLDQIIDECSIATLAPVGTRPHSMACAIYASKHPKTRVIFDYAIENQNRTHGIAGINIYHLSTFLPTV